MAIPASNPTTSHARGSPRRLTWTTSPTRAPGIAKRRLSPVTAITRPAATTVLTCASRIFSASTSTAILLPARSPLSLCLLGVGSKLGSKLLEQLARAGGEHGRYVDLHDDDERSAPPPVETRNPVALHGEHGAGLRSGRNDQRKGGIVVIRLESRHPNLGAEHRVGEGNVHARHQVAPVALEARIVLDVYLDVEMPAGELLGPGIP